MNEDFTEQVISDRKCDVYPGHNNNKNNNNNNNTRYTYNNAPCVRVPHYCDVQLFLPKRTEHEPYTVS
jgi:hypothetical protein